MKQKSSMKCWAGVATAACFLCLSCGTLAAAEGWQNEVTIYGWFSDISGELQTGAEFTYDVDDIVDDLEMIFMGGYEGRYDRWSVVADVVYLDVGDDSDITVPAGEATADLDLTSWIFSAAVGYDMIQTDMDRMAVVGGIRYIDIDVESDLSLQGSQVSGTSGSEDMLDGIIGVRGYVSLWDNWFLPYYADIGTGDSDVSYQFFGGVGYHFGWGDVRLGYRYLRVEMDDDKLMEDMTVSGPVLGVGFRF